MFLYAMRFVFVLLYCRLKVILVVCCYFVVCVWCIQQKKFEMLLGIILVFMDKDNDNIYHVP